MPDRVKPECRVNLSVDEAGKAVSRHISFYQGVPEDRGVFLFHKEHDKVLTKSLNIIVPHS